MKTKILIALVAVQALIYGCSTVPITGRSQLNLLPESQLNSMSMVQYQDVLDTSRVLPPSDPRAQKVKDVGLEIAAAVEKYMAQHNLSDRVENYQWSFHTIDEPVVNAWCMPGGRVVFYTGILPICQDKAGIAVVMGHEIAHAVARHGNERMSQSLVIQGAGMTLDVLLAEKPALTHQLLMQSYGIGTTLGSLAFSRAHESEADKLGLIFMAMAGYDPRTAPEFWKRMSAQGGGGAPIEFLSTHPSDQTRIQDLNEYMSEALKYYKPND